MPRFQLPGAPPAPARGREGQSARLGRLVGRPAGRVSGPVFALLAATAVTTACGRRPPATSVAGATPTANAAAPTPRAPATPAALAVASPARGAIGGSLVFTRHGQVYRFHPRSGRMEGPWLKDIVALAAGSPGTAGAMELSPRGRRWRPGRWPEAEALGFGPGGRRWAGTVDGAFTLAEGPSGTVLQTLNPRPFDPTLGLSWSADGASLAYVTASSQGSVLHVADADGHQLWSLGPEVGLRSPKWSPDGLRLAFIVDPGAPVVPGLWTVAANGTRRVPAPTRGNGVAVWIGWAGPWLLWATPSRPGHGVAVLAAHPEAASPEAQVVEGIDGPVVWIPD